MKTYWLNKSTLEIFEADAPTRETEEPDGSVKKRLDSHAYDVWRMEMRASGLRQLTAKEAELMRSKKAREAKAAG